jgi:hypothetical protein
MSLDTNELRKLANSDSRNFDEMEIALHEAADEIDRLYVALAKARAAERAIHYWKEQNEKLWRVYAASTWSTWRRSPQTTSSICSKRRGRETGNARLGHLNRCAALGWAGWHGRLG